MKKSIYLMMGACIILLSACKDTAEVRQAEGGYTYKTSGVVRVQHGDTIDNVHLAPETGTMVLASDKDGERATLNFNHSGGDGYDMHVSIRRDSLFLDPMQRTIDVEVAQDTLAFGTVLHQREAFQIKVNGDGKLLSNGDVCFTLTYTGHSINGNYTLSGTDIHVHCKRNAH